MADCRNCGQHISNKKDVLSETILDLSVMADDADTAADNGFDATASLVSELQSLVRKLQCINDGKHVAKKLIRKAR